MARARAALERHAWTEAFDAFGQADAPGVLSGDDLEAYAVSAFFVARAMLGVEIKERAFRAHVADGNGARAAVVAIDIGREYWYMGRHSIAAGWLRRAERLLETEPEGYAHGWLALAKGESARAQGDIDVALAFAEEAVAIGGRNTDHDLEAAAMTSLGGLKIATGATSAGIQMIEDAAFSAANGELSPLMTGVTYCSMIAACRDLTDYRRASEWIDATELYCTRQSVSGFPGVCRIHRAEVKAVTGAWERAAKELEQATSELAAYNAVPPQADGYYAIGDIRRRMGDLDGAEAALRAAHGRAAPRSRRWRSSAWPRARRGTAAIDAAVAETWDRMASGASSRRRSRSRSPPATSGGPGRRSRSSRDRRPILRIAGARGQPAVAWGGCCSPRAMRPGRGASSARPSGAGARSARPTRSPGRGSSSPRRSRARRRDERRPRAAGGPRRVPAARRSPRLAAAERAARDAEERRRGPEQVRMTFMFTDIVGSTDLAEALGDAAWERLLRWHDDALRRASAERRGKVVNSDRRRVLRGLRVGRTGGRLRDRDPATLRDHRADRLRPVRPDRPAHRRRQPAGRRLQRHGRPHRRPRRGARRGGEILATAETLTEAGAATTEPPRTVTVKGVAQPLLRRVGRLAGRRGCSRLQQLRGGATPSASSCRSI